MIPQLQPLVFSIDQGSDDVALALCSQAVIYILQCSTLPCIFHNKAGDLEMKLLVCECKRDQNTDFPRRRSDTLLNSMVINGRLAKFPSGI